MNYNNQNNLDQNNLAHPQQNRTWYNILKNRKILLALLGVASLATAEKTGINDFIRERISSVVMTLPEQGGPLNPIHNLIRKHCHPDGESF